MSKQFYFKQFSLAQLHSLNIKTVLFQAIQFSISTHFSSIWPIDRTLSGATTSGQCGPESDSNEGVLRIPQSSNITETSPSDGLELYPGRSLGGWGFLPLCREALCVFYNPSQSDKLKNECTLQTSSLVWGLSVRQWRGRPGFSPRSCHTKDLKSGTWCLLV